jgi:hypothetical protein
VIKVCLPSLKTEIWIGVNDTLEPFYLVKKK